MIVLKIALSVEKLSCENVSSPISVSTGASDAEPFRTTLDLDERFEQCASKDDEVVEYALSRTLSPAVIAEYHTQLPDKKLLQAKLREFYALNVGDGEQP